MSQVITEATEWIDKQNEDFMLSDTLRKKPASGWRGE